MSNVVAEIPLDRFSVDDRLELLERVWDSLVDDGQFSVPDWHLELVARRIERADANPSASIPLEQLEREMMGSRTARAWQGRLGPPTDPP